MRIRGLPGPHPILPILLSCVGDQYRGVLVIRDHFEPNRKLTYLFGLTVRPRRVRMRQEPLLEPLHNAEPVWEEPKGPPQVGVRLTPGGNWVNVPCVWGTTVQVAAPCAGHEAPAIDSGVR